MLIEKTNPTGIDIAIQRFQKNLYDQLKTIWPVDDSSFNACGRAYRNTNDDGYIPEIYDGSNEYKEVLFDDSLKALCFFGVGDTRTYNQGSSIAKVALIFMVKVDQIKPTITHRGDEEIHVDVEKICSQKRSGFTLTGIETGIDRVFREYSGLRLSDGMKNADMHPRHCFRLNFDVLFNINDC